MQQARVNILRLCDRRFLRFVAASNSMLGPFASAQNLSRKIAATQMLVGLALALCMGFAINWRFAIWLCVGVTLIAIGVLVQGQLQFAGMTLSQSRQARRFFRAVTMRWAITIALLWGIFALANPHGLALIVGMLLAYVVFFARSIKG
jgi:ATP synthase I chain